MSEKQRILVIEDEQSIRNGLADLLTYHGYTVSLACDGESGLNLALSEKHDLILVDVMLPICDGFTVCDQIRRANREQAIIMLTAKDEEEDIITGLSLGADDYITKPFSLQELLLRIQAVLRRNGNGGTSERELWISNVLCIDTCNLSGVLHGNDETPIEFTRREIEILQYLKHNSDRPVSRDELLTKVWGYRASNLETRTVDIHNVGSSFNIDYI